jgi:hypothetical protein
VTLSLDGQEKLKDGHEESKVFQLTALIDSKADA